VKIYTKILIGMVVGAVIGLTLGPKSNLLEHDLYKIKDASKATILTDRGDPASALPLPEGVSLDFHAEETFTEVRLDAAGVSHEVPILVAGSFTFTRKLALKDRKGELRAALGDPGLGSEVRGFLVIESQALPGGGFLTTFNPVSSLGDTIITWISPVGDLFMRLITMVIVPLVFASLLVGVAGLGDVRKLGRLGGKTLALYLTTTAFAVSIGLMVAHIVRPGDRIDPDEQAALVAQFELDAGDKVEAAANAPSMVENILNIIPKNPVESLGTGNMLQVIFFALIFGIALTMLKPERSRQIVDFFDTVQHAMIMIIHMVMAVAPYGVAALLAEVVGQSGVSLLLSLVIYALVVLLGLALHLGLVYGGLVTLVAKMPMIRFLKAARPAQMIGFSTSSSSAALPVTMECAEENLGVSNSVSSFVIPLGSTVNMDGTALYQGVAAIFIAQVFQVDLSFGDQLGIVLAATAASIGAAGVPGAGMITLAMVLTAAGIPPVGVALILGVDRILDMFRTAVNVTGDLAVTAVMAVSEGETLRILSSDDDARDPDHGFEGRLDRAPRPVVPSDDPNERDDGPSS
jgi:Na+/H+-dicarboxylate symporter